MRFALKDKARQAQLDALSDVNKFSEQFQIACKAQMSDRYYNVIVCFGDLQEPADRIYGESHGLQNRLVILKEEIEVIEDLKPNIWHLREKFDGNPNRYVLVERIEYEDGDSFYRISKDDFGITHLGVGTTHFMYIERPEKSNEQLQP